VCGACRRVCAEEQFGCLFMRPGCAVARRTESTMLVYCRYPLIVFGLRMKRMWRIYRSHSTFVSREKENGLPET
jgi:hypothetical protein